MIVVSFGGGTDSTAMLLGMHERNIMPDLILFADTGGEKPHTYKHVKTFSKWLVDHGMPEIIVVKKGGRNETLEEECIRRNALPPIAYGFKTCSQKYKIQPQEKYLNSYPMSKEVWKSGGKVQRYVGYDVSEDRRAKPYEDDKYINVYPLVEWGWDRIECIAAIERHGIERPGKSACFFCPSSKPNEVKWLAKAHPDLYRRAVEMERNANLKTVKGLGRDYSWEELVDFDNAQLKMFEDQWTTLEVPCGCYDG